MKRNLILFLIGMIGTFTVVKLVVVPATTRTSSGVCHYRAGGILPDPRCTPGATNPSVTQGNIHSTICVRGWTSTVRPPVTVTEPQKFRSMHEYGDSTVPGEAAKYEYDHLIPLELGGATDDLRNLWPEPGGSPNPKDLIEHKLRQLVCSGQMKLAHAQHLMRTDWRQA